MSKKIVLSKRSFTFAACVVSALLLTACTDHKIQDSKTTLTTTPAVLTAMPMAFPSDVKQTCVPSVETWFANGTVTDGGAVDAANSTGTFDTDCDFYEWGSQMFLWLTSPANGDNGTYTFNQPGFYEVTPLDSSGDREFLAPIAGTGGLGSLALRTTKTDDSELETAQADGNALISNKDDLVFYGLHANDIFAYYRSEEANGYFPSGSLKNNFPTSALEVDEISLLLQKGQPPISDPTALAMELKTAWVEANSVSEISQYITITAEVPVYSKNTANTIWTETSQTESKTLALIGLHIAGTVTGHPEMVWSTFEHVNNAPDKSYYYLTSSNSSGNNPFSANPVVGEWTLSTTPATDINSISPTAAYNAPDYATSTPASITAEGSSEILPADVVRLNPWGNVSDPSSADKTSVALSNTDLISLNAAVMSALADKQDVRANYIQVGGIWSSKGNVPVSGSTSSTFNSFAGGLNLSNTTMETFHQFPDANNGFETTNCFACHNNPNNATPPPSSPSMMTCLNNEQKVQQNYDISHIFCAIEPIWVNLPPFEPGLPAE